MAIKVVINGFGRIGRTTFAHLIKMNKCEVIAINDFTNPKILVDLINYDISKGRYTLDNKLEIKNNNLIIDNKIIKVYTEKNIKNLLSEKTGIDMIIDCSDYKTIKEIRKNN